MPLVHYHSESVLTYFVCAADLAALSTSCKFRLFPEQTCMLGFPARRKWDLSVPLTHASHISGASCGTRLHKRGQRKKMLFKQCGGILPLLQSLSGCLQGSSSSLCCKNNASPKRCGQSVPSSPAGGRQRGGRAGVGQSRCPSLPPSHTSLQSQGTQSAT